MSVFRTIHPKRTCAKQFVRYRSYKNYLTKDFAGACGYCGDSDQFCGGPKFYHIDHFRPKTKFKHLETRYENLVYACSFCNVSKSDDWPCSDPEKTYENGEGYIDPCEEVFVDNFGRRADGSIFPKTDVGGYMFRKLKLGLRRHQIIWLLTKLCSQLEELDEICGQKEGDDDELFVLRDYRAMVKEYLRLRGVLCDIA